VESRCAVSDAAASSTQRRACVAVSHFTAQSSEGHSNLRQRPHAAMVLGSAAAGSARTVQLEGPADEPRGEELARLLTLSFERFPDGRERQR